MILDEIKALLVADAGLLSLIGTRVHDMVLPRGFVLPALVMHKVTTVSGYTMQGSTQPADITVQFDVYADTALTARQIREALEDALQDFKGILSGGSVVQGTFWITDMDMPYTPDINKTAVGFRIMSHVRFVYVEATS